MIATLTVNPAIDRNITVDRLVFEDRAYILSSTEAAGGRGILASQVIHSFGGQTLAVLISGGPAGQKLEQLLKGLGFPVKVLRIRREVRTTLTITDKQGLTIKLNERGPLIEADELEGLERLVLNRLSKTDWLMMCGSIPPGVAPNFYRGLAAAAKAAGVKVLIDTDGDALVGAIEAAPTVLTPNQYEAERLLGTALVTRSQFLEAARRMVEMGADSVLLSLGSRGAVGARAGELIEVVPPRVDAVCPIGAGDALAAAFVWAISKNDDFADALRWGVAAGTASAMLPGTNFATYEQTQRMYERVEVRQAE